MPLDRRALKRAARDSIRTATPSARMVTLVYILLTSGLTTVVNLFLQDPSVEMLALLEQGIDPTYVLEYMFSGEGLTLFFFVSVLLSLYSCVMQVGYIGYAMGVARGRPAGYGDLIGAFSFAGRVIGVAVMVFLYAMMWSMVVILPFTVVLVFVAIALDPFTTAVLYIVPVLLVMMLMLRYALVFYALADDPGVGVFGAIRKSQLLMRGNKLRYVTLMLSFFGWMVLASGLAFLGASVGETLGGPYLSAILGLLAGLPLELWLVPYMECAVVNFYDALQAGAAPEQPHRPAGGDPEPKRPAYRDDPWEN